MHQDKILARIFLIFSVANIALAAPTIVRQRHLDVAQAASQKRSENEETPPESSSRMPSHDGLTNRWTQPPAEPPAEPPPAPANRITTLPPGPPIWDNNDLRPQSSSRLNGWLYWLDPASLPEPYSTAANRIQGTTHAPGAPVWGSEATGDLPHELPSVPLPGPPHNSPPDESALSSSDGIITTQASGVESSGNGATGDLPHELSSVPLPRPPHNSPAGSSANGETGDLPPASDRITTQASGATSSPSSESGHLGDLPLPPHQGSAPVSLAAPEAEELLRDALTHTFALREVQKSGFDFL